MVNKRSTTTFGAFFLCLLIGSRLASAQFLATQSADARNLAVTGIEPVTLLRNLSHKPGMTDATVVFGVHVVGTAEASATSLTLAAPAGYEFGTDCKIDPPTDIDNVTIPPNTGTEYTPIRTTISECAADATTNTTAAITLNAVLSDQGQTSPKQMIAIAVKVARTPTENLSSNQMWKVTYDGQTNKQSSNSLTVQEVTGWKTTGLKTPDNKIGSSSSDSAVMQPTQLDGDTIVSIAFYFQFSSEIEANKSFSIVLPTQLTFAKTGKCDWEDLEVKIFVCSTTACTAGTIGEIKSDAIDGDTNTFGCEAENKYLRFINKDTIPTSSGVYVSLKVKSAKLDNDTLSGAASIYSCSGNMCKSPSNYMTDDTYVDFGMTKNNVNVKKSGAVKLCTIISIIAAVISGIY